MIDNEIRLRYGRHTLLASGDMVIIDGNDTFDLRVVHAVGFTSYGRAINGTYQGTDFILNFWQGKRGRNVILSTNARDEHLEEYRQAWLEIVGRIGAIAIPRIAEEIAAKVRAGETVKFGSLALSPEGAKKRGLFSKLVPWSLVTRTVLDKGQLRVLGRKTPDAPETVIGEVAYSDLNASALPSVVIRLSA